MLRAAARCREAAGEDRRSGRGRGGAQDLRGNRPPGKRRRPRHAQCHEQAFPRRARRARGAQAQGHLRACWKPSPTSARTWPTTSRASSSRTPDPRRTQALSKHGNRTNRPVGRRPPGRAGHPVRFHERVPRRRQLDRHGRLHRRAQAHAGRRLRRVLQLRRDLRLPPERGRHHRQGNRAARGGGYARHLRRARGGHHLERDHLVLRHSQQARRTR